MSSTVASATDTASSTVSAAASASTSAAAQAQPAIFKVVGICLAVGSGLLIGSSFVIKKKGLLAATRKAGNSAGEGHAYLKNWVWWTGMIIMIVGEICNFAAFAFTEAILVTPLGALSVVICAILSTFFLKETLTFFGWIGCALCIMGATILALNAPEQQSVTQIKAFEKLFISPGWLVWMSLSIIASVVLAFFVAPKYGKKNMFVYITICSLIGGLSVSCLQGLGASILTSIRGDNQFKHWFIYFLMVFVVITLLTEINYLNKALELFNTSMVTPTYYIIFTTCTLVSSFILYQGLKASAVSLITMVLGFLVTCLGITLLQMSKVDPKKFEGLDRRSTILLTASRSATEDVEKNDIVASEEPSMDALRGGFGTVGSIIRARSMSRRMSNASSLVQPGRGDVKYGSNSRSGSMVQGHAMVDVPRYSLSDGPMMDDGHLSPNRGRSTSGIHFDDRDKIHQYSLGGHTAIHSSRPATSPSRTTFPSVLLPGGALGSPFGPPPGAGLAPGGGGGGGGIWYGRDRADSRATAGSGQSRFMESPMELDEDVADEKQLGGPGGADEARRFHSFRSRGEQAPRGAGQPHAYRTPYDAAQSETESDADGDHGDRTPRLEVRVSSPDHPLQQRERERERSTGGSGSRTGLSGLIASLGASGPDLRLHFGGHKDKDAHGHGHGSSRRGSREKDYAHEDAVDDGRRGGAHRGTRDYPHLPKARKTGAGAGAGDEDVERQERAGLVRAGGGARESDSESEREREGEDAASPGASRGGGGRPISGLSGTSTMGVIGLAGAPTEHARNWDGIDVDSRRASSAVMRAEEKHGGAGQGLDPRWRFEQAGPGQGQGQGGAGSAGPSPGTTPRGEYPPRIR